MKLKLRIMNIVYLLLAGFSMFWLLTKPFADLSISIKLTEENSEVLIKDDDLSSLGITRTEMFENGPIDIGLKNVKVTTQNLVDIWRAGDQIAYVNDYIIEPNVDTVVDQLVTALDPVSRKIVGSAVRNMVEKELEKSLAEGVDLYEKLAESNISKEDVNNSINKIIDEVATGHSTVESLSNTLITEYNTYASALGGTELNSTEMQENIEDALDKLGLVKEDGTISTLSDVIDNLLDEIFLKSGESGETPTSSKKMLYSAPSEDDSNAELKAKVKEIINSKLDDQKKSYVALGLKGASITALICALGFALKILQVIMCFFIKKPYLRTELFGNIGRVIQLLFLAITSISLGISKLDISKIPYVGTMVPSELSSLISGLSANFMFAFSVTAVACIIDSIYSIFYGITKRRFKRKWKKGEIQ